MRASIVFAAALSALTLSQAANAQTQAAPPAGAAAVAPNDSTPKLVFEREVFTYPGRARRDPFQPLTADVSGPLFPDLRLGSIIYDAANPARSIVTVRDAANKPYRLRRGDSVGNATVTGIEKLRVIFSVIDFGIRSTKVLELKKQEGA